MIGRLSLSRKKNLNRGLIVLGLLLCLVKGQSSLYASSGCSNDPVASTIELVLTDLPNHGFHFQPSARLTPAGNVIAISAPVFHQGPRWISTADDNHARLVLKLCGQVIAYHYQPGPTSTIRLILHQSPDTDPLLQQA
jgi:hypothetical protein